VAARLTEVLRPHATADLATPHHIGPSRTVGYRIRELRASPGWSKGDWPIGHDLARTYMNRAWEYRSSGRWQVTAADLAAVRAAGLDREPVYDYPPTPDTPSPSWLQKAHRLVTLACTLRTAADMVPRTADGYIAPLAMVLDGVGGACSHLRESVQEVERLWAAEPTEPADLASWELSHVPGPLVTQTDQTTYLVHELATWLSGLTLEE
jgi:hypothetical protein